MQSDGERSDGLNDKGFVSFASLLARAIGGRRPLSCPLRERELQQRYGCRSYACRAAGWVLTRHSLRQIGFLTRHKL